MIEGAQIDFSEGIFHKLLGLEPKVYDQPCEEGTYIINITRGLDSFFIRCNLVERNYQPEMNNLLFDILPFAEPENLNKPERLVQKANESNKIKVWLGQLVELQKQ